MIRRFTSLFVVWFGLLTIIVPSVTCATATSHGDCCPPEGAPPCGECPDKRQPRAPDRAHCVVVPTQAIASPVAKQSSVELGLFPDAPVILPAVHRPSVATPSSAESTAHLEYAGTYASRAAFTYLVTGRLRL